MTRRRVKTIAKVEYQRRDDRSIITRVKPAWFLPKVTVEPKSNVTVRFQAASWGTELQSIGVKSAQVTNQIWFSTLFPDYVPKHYNKKVIPATYRVSEWVLVKFPADESGKLRKLARPWHGPYQRWRKVVKLGGAN